MTNNTRKLKMQKLTLTEAARDKVAKLLEDHYEVTRALKCVDRPKWSASIGLSEEKTDDYITIEILSSVAQQALLLQKASIEVSLGQYGVAVMP